MKGVEEQGKGNSFKMREGQVGKNEDMKDNKMNGKEICEHGGNMIMVRKGQT